MQQITGWIALILGGALYLAQLVSSVDFRLAQRLGIQERPEATDALLQRSERYTAYWDLVSLGWLPLAGLLMIADHRWWPVVALIGGAIYLDTAGREAAKYLALKREGVRMGSAGQQKTFFASYVLMALVGAAVLGLALSAPGFL